MTIRFIGVLNQNAIKRWICSRLRYALYSKVCNLDEIDSSVETHIKVIGYLDEIAKWICN